MGDTSEETFQLWLYVEAREHPAGILFLSWESLEMGRRILSPLVDRYPELLAAFAASWRDGDSWVEYVLTDRNWEKVDRPFNILEAANAKPARHCEIRQAASDE